MKNPNIILTPDQQEAFDEIVTWLQNTKSDWQNTDNLKTLSGFAGTGKTTLLDYIVDYAKKNNIRTAVTATTNKAVKVLHDKVDANTFMTIHSALGIKAVRKGSVEVFEPDNYNDSQLTDFSLVIIDEASMISSVDESEDIPSMLTIILRQVEFSDTRVLFCGDPAQLQPINETVSQCFDFNPVTLTTIVRHDDGIAHVAKKLRMQTKNTPVSSLYSPPDVEPISLPFVRELFSGWRDNPDGVRLLSWRNITVDKWNRELREADYGEENLDPFVVGDIVIANEPCIKEHMDGTEEMLMLNSQEGEVLKVKETETAYLLTVKVYDSGNKKVVVQVVKPKYAGKLRQKLNSLASTREWDKYWTLKKSYHSIKHCYAMTTHKSQGSTFDNIIVDTKDVFFNRNIENRNQLLYVGITRAAKNVYLL